MMTNPERNDLFGVRFNEWCSIIYSSYVEYEWELWAGDS